MSMFGKEEIMHMNIYSGRFFVVSFLAKCSNFAVCLKSDQPL
jgi:hypothetical protein